MFCRRSVMDFRFSVNFYGSNQVTLTGAKAQRSSIALKNQTVGTKLLSAHTIDWPARRTKETWYRMCVRATDKAGNRTGRVCSTLKLTS